ncbi:MAG TPA: Na+/H+ antiporter subunit E [Burkholderiales bacterium]|nr:Na+/H+ antiporter subunit E [Burkholderiales bacterium]
MRLFLALLALWLILNESLAPGQVLVGVLLALGGSAVFARLQPPTGRVRSRPGAALQLLGLVLADIVRSNLAVARIVLGLGAARRKAGFLALPLELRHPAGLAVVACIITATPGTSWVRYDSAANVVTIHVLDLLDADDWIRLFKQRYERRLLEIFG